MRGHNCNGDDTSTTNWYYAGGARRLIKSFASVFGEGAERASFSGTNDLMRGNQICWINLLGTRQENYAEKPQFYTYQPLIDKLRDFTSAAPVNAGSNPRTRVYRFDRPRGPVFIAWSETGDVPPGLDYSIPTGEQISFNVGSDSVLITKPVTSMSQLQPLTELRRTSNKVLTLRLGYEPVFIEQASTSTEVEYMKRSANTVGLQQNYPNPFSERTTIRFALSSSTSQKQKEESISLTQNCQ